MSPLRELLKVMHMWSEPSIARARRGTLIASCIFGLVVLGSNLNPKVHAKFVEAFGETPFGLPVTLVVILAELLLLLPVPFFFRHVVELAIHAQAEGRAFGMSYLLYASRNRPELRGSVWWCLGGVGYLVILCGAWIAYAAARGI